jgi:hypothetical protein
MASTSNPLEAAGNSPTADSSEVRPPTQSHMGNVVIHSSPLAVASGVRRAVLLSGRGEPEARFLVGGSGFEHAVASFFRRSRLRDDHRERLVEPFSDRLERAVHPVRIGVVEEERAQRVGGRSERAGNELGPEGRPPDADHEEVGEPLGARGADLALVHIARELHDARPRPRDRVADRHGRARAGLRSQ